MRQVAILSSAILLNRGSFLNRPRVTRKQIGMCCGKLSSPKCSLHALNKEYELECEKFFSLRSEHHDLVAENDDLHWS